MIVKGKVRGRARVGLKGRVRFRVGWVKGRVKDEGKDKMLSLKS